MNWTRGTLNRLIMAMAELGEILIVRDMRPMSKVELDNFERVYARAQELCASFWSEVDAYRNQVVRPQLPEEPRLPPILRPEFRARAAQGGRGSGPHGR